MTEEVGYAASLWSYDDIAGDTIANNFLVRAIVWGARRYADH
jgi:hypothetical protein